MTSVNGKSWLATTLRAGRTFAILALLPVALSGSARAGSYLSPTALAVAPDNQHLYVACETAAQVLVYDLTAHKVSRRFSVPPAPTGLALNAKGDRLFVTCAAPVSTVCVVDTSSGKVLARISAGYHAMSPVLSPDERTLYVCNRFTDDVSVIDLQAQREVRRIKVLREPVASALTHDGRYLIVANHLPKGRANAATVAAQVSIIDLKKGEVTKPIELPNGSGQLRDVAISPDGKYACVTHVLSRFHLPTTQVDRGWMNSNGFTLIDLARLERINTVLLDNVDSGAANPWGVTWTPDGRQLVATHAGTHEISVIEFAPLLEKLNKVAAVKEPEPSTVYISASRTAADVPNDLAFLVGMRKRIRLEGQGPRDVVVVGRRAYTAQYFADALCEVDLDARRPRPKLLALGPKPDPDAVRRGEMYFNDATLCFQGWQSCASCHSSDGRVDGLNWDLLNDGIGNPKNTRSLLLAFETPPSMALGVRANAAVAVRAGIRHSLFTVQPESVAEALDAYLQSLKPMPSPYLDNGQLSAAAQRGKKLFFSEEVGCAKCHTPDLYTDLQAYDVGTQGPYDKASDHYDTPTLIEVWRTAPYLHDGSAASIREVLTLRNHHDRHGHTSHLSPGQIRDLAEFVLSL